MRRTVAIFLAVAVVAASLIGALLGIQTPSTAASPKSEVVISNLQQDHGFVLQSSAGTQQDDLAEYALGTQSLKITSDGNGEPVFTRKELSPALNFTDRMLKIWIKIDGVGNIGELRLSATGDDFRNWADYWISGDKARATFLRDNQWNVITLSSAQATMVGRPDLSHIDSIQLRVSDVGRARQANVWINGIALVPQNDRAVITFAFDDGYESDYTSARPVLDKYHFSATSYVIPSLAGSLDRLSVDQMKKLQDLNGWDIASHSYSHSNLTARVRPEIDDDLALSKQFLQRNGLYRGSDHFAYPYGEFDNDTLRSVVQKYFSTARTAEGPSETLPPSDPYRLRVMMVSNTTSPAEVSQRVQASIDGGDWLILVFHRIVDSDARLDTMYLKSDFELIVSDVASRGVDVLTVSEVYAEKFR